MTPSFANLVDWFIYIVCGSVQPVQEERVPPVLRKGVSMNAIVIVNQFEHGVDLITTNNGKGDVDVFVRRADEFLLFGDNTIDGWHCSGETYVGLQQHTVV
jgi:hypothetical protein